MENLMKKIIAILLSLSIIFALSVVALGADCTHSDKSREFHEATCSSRAKNVYTCNSCGFVETAYLSPSYTLNESKLSFLFEGNVEDGKLTVVCTAFGNPGICGSRFTINYNPAALTPVSMENGDMWSEDVVTLTINESKKYVRFFAEDWGNNMNSGLVFKAVFDVKDIPANWGIKIETIPQDFVNWDTGKTVSHEVVSTVTAGYGSHAWDEGTVALQPTVYDEGVREFCCTFCDATMTDSIPVLEKWTKGDINNDSKINLGDMFKVKTYLSTGAGLSYASQPFDAADMNDDRKINISDIMALKTKLLER